MRVWGCNGILYSGRCSATVIKVTNVLGSTTVLHYVGHGSSVTDQLWLHGTQRQNKVVTEGGGGRNWGGGGGGERRQRCRGQRAEDFRVNYRTESNDRQLAA